MSTEYGMSISALLNSKFSIPNSQFQILYFLSFDIPCSVFVILFFLPGLRSPGIDDSLQAEKEIA